MENVKKYYVYTHSINNHIFYVGSNWSKGNPQRAYEKTGRPEKWWEFVNENNGKYDISIYSRYSDYKDCLKNELKLIEELHDVGLAEASNEDQRGERNPMWGRKGDKSPFYGKERPKNVKDAISKANKGRYIGGKSVLSKKMQMILPSGEKFEFDSSSECALFIKKEFGVRLDTSEISSKITKKVPWNTRKHPLLKGTIFLRN